MNNNDVIKLATAREAGKTIIKRRHNSDTFSGFKMNVDEDFNFVDFEYAVKEGSKFKVFWVNDFGETSNVYIKGWEKLVSIGALELAFNHLSTIDEEHFDKTNEIIEQLKGLI